MPMIKVLTVWAPWAQLIIAGAKPLEFRKWDYRKREPKLEGQRIGIHAGARPIRWNEVKIMRDAVLAGESSLLAEKAMPIIERLLAAYKCSGVLEQSALLGTAVIGRPRDVDRQLQNPDSTRIDHHMFAWPMLDPQPLPAPIPCRGRQGFWNMEIPA